MGQQMEQADGGFVDASVDTLDTQIEQRLRAILVQIPALREIEVSVRAGLVTLEGKVENRPTLERAEGIARKLEGVIDVEDSGVEIKAGVKDAETEVQATDDRIQRQLEQIFSGVDTFKQLQITVDHGVVTLSGVALEGSVVENAVEIAKEIEGVVYVNEEIEVTTDIGDRVSPAVQKLKALGSKTVAFLPLLGISLLVVLFFAWLGKWISTLDFIFSRFTDKPLIRGIIKQAVRGVVIFIGVVIALEILDATSLAGAVLGTAGVAGVALGFAFQDIVENYLASVILSFRQPFSKGDVIKIDEHEGIVVRLTTRDTVLMTYDGNHLRIPNAQVFKSVLYNYSLNPKRRFEFSVGVSAEANLMEVKRLGLEAIGKIKGVLDDPKPFMLIKELGDSSIVCVFYGWIDQREQGILAVRTEALRRVKLTLEREGVDMPEPIYRLNVKEHLPVDPDALVEPASSREPIEPDEAAAAFGGPEPTEEAQLKRQIREEKPSGEEDLLK